MNSTKKTQGMHPDHWFNNLVVNPIKPFHKIPKGSNGGQMGTRWFHIILYYARGRR